jgi:hypothetical protein
MIQPNQEAYVVFRIAQAETPAAAAAEFTGQEGLTVVEQRTTQVNGHEARRVLAEGQTQQGQTVRALAYFIAYDDQVYSFQGLTTGPQYDTYRSALERPMTGFDALRDPEKLNVQPTRLAIRPAPRADAFRAFVDEDALPEDLSLNDLAIINQVQLDERIEQGRPLKLPE